MIFSITPNIYFATIEIYDKNFRCPLRKKLPKFPMGYVNKKD